MIEKYLTSEGIREFQKLAHLLQTGEPKPYLWVGAGLSKAAGYPLWGELIEVFNKQLEAVGLTPAADQYKAIDQFINEFSNTEMRDILNKKFGNVVAQPTPLHELLVQLPWEGIITTNYDPLVEYACRDKKIPARLIIIQDNLELGNHGMLPIYKIHGSHTSLEDVVLAKRDYDSFAACYKHLSAFLHMLYLKHPIVYIGFGMEDANFIRILEDLDEDGRKKVWRSWYLISRGTTKEAETIRLLSEANHHPIEYYDHPHLTPLIEYLVQEVCPPKFEFDYEIRLEQQGDMIERHFSGAGLQPVKDSYEEDLESPGEFWTKLTKFEELASKNLTTDHEIKELNWLGAEIGDKLFQYLIPEPVQEGFAKKIKDDFRSGRRSRLRLASSSKKLMGLPWELMRIGSEFAVQQGYVILVRRINESGRSLPEMPADYLKMAVAIAAPEGGVSLSYEEEMARLARCLDGLEKRGVGTYPIELSFTELGQLQEIEHALLKENPHILHISGHGTEDSIAFEHEDGGTETVSSEQFTRELCSISDKASERTAFSIPLLYFLSTCRSASGASPFAAALNEAGAPAVIGFQWSVGDNYATIFEEHFYRGIAEGRTISEALRIGRTSAIDGARPFEWATAVLYLRGTDKPLVRISPEARESRWNRVERIRRDRQLIREHPESDKKNVFFVKEGFIGRRRDIRGIRRALLESKRFLVIRGPGGVGKTTLAGHLLDHIFKDYAQVLLTSNIKSIDEVVTTLRKEGENICGKDWIPPKLEELTKPEDQLAAIAEQIKSHTPFIIYWDNFEDYLKQKGDEEFAKFSNLSIRDCIAVLSNCVDRDFILLLTSRYPFEDFGQSDHELGELSPGETWRYCRFLDSLHWVSEPNVRKIHKAIAGHPRALDLLDELTALDIDKWQSDNFEKSWIKHLNSLPKDKRLEAEWDPLKLRLDGVKAKTAKDQLFEQLWQTLPKDAQELLLRASVYERPFGRKGLEVQWRGKHDFASAAEKLCKRSFILKTKTKDKTVWHTVYATTRHALRDSKYAQMPEIIKDAHATAGAYLESLGDVSRNFGDHLEARYHYMESGKWDDAGRLSFKLMNYLEDQRQWSYAIKLGTEIEEKVNETKVIAPLKGILAIIFSTAREFKEAKKRYAEALQIYRALAEKDPEKFLPGVAMTCNNLANLLSDTGDYMGACQTYSEALQIYRFLAEKDPEEFLPHLAAACVNLGSLLAEGREYSNGLKMYKEGLEKYLLLAEKNPDKFMPYVATTFNNIGGMLSGSGEYDDARWMLEGALQIRRLLAEKDPAAFMPFVATTCNNLGNVISRSGNHSRAREMYEEALQKYRELADKDPVVFLPEVALVCNNLAAVLSETEDYEGALKMFQETLQIRRSLAEKNPEAFLPHLAMTCYNLGSLLHQTKNLPEARNMYEEALQIRRTLAEKNAGAYLPEVGATCNNLALLFSEVGDYLEARDKYEEALQSYYRSANEYVNVFSKDLLIIINGIASLVEEKDFENKEDWARLIWNRLVEEAGNAFPLVCKPFADMFLNIHETELAVEAYYFLFKILETVDQDEKKEAEKDFQRVKKKLDNENFAAIQEKLDEKWKNIRQKLFGDEQ